MFDDKIQELNKDIEAHPIPFEKRTYTVSEIQDILGVGKNAAYAAVKSGEFRVIRVGGTHIFSMKIGVSTLNDLRIHSTPQKRSSLPWKISRQKLNHHRQ